MHPRLEMSEAERTSFLAERRTARLATNGPDGYPHNVPVGYHYHDGRLFVPSDEQSQKIANIRADDRVCSVVDEGRAGVDYDSLKGVMLRGTATVFEDTGHDEVHHDDILEAVFDGEILDQDRYDRVDRVVVEIDPEDVVTWDFSKVDFE